MVFTDGISTDLEDLKEQAAALKSQATVYAFGIGSEINKDELEVRSKVTVHTESFMFF